MHEQPSGTFTFLFTDIEGSTQRWERSPNAMKAALKRHDSLVRNAIESGGGHVFKTIGDAFCAAFRTAPEALAAAVDAQRALATVDWSQFRDDFEPIVVRMGIHTGTADKQDGDYQGQPLNRCARLEASGHGGQILVSLATQQLVRDDLPSGIALRDLGQHRLKDLTHSEHIFQLVAPDMPDVRRAPVTAERLHVGDRIVLDDSARDRTLPESLEALQHVVLDETADARLTPAQVQEIIEHRPTDLVAYWLGRVAEWSQPRYRVDGRFVALELLVDMGGQSLVGRWHTSEQRYDDLGTLVADVTDPALVLLGSPGAGKTTLLQRYELDEAIGALAGGEDGDAGQRADGTITFFVQLNQYKPARIGEAPPSPGQWLTERWSLRYPDLVPLDELLASGRMILLLDGLNEMPLPTKESFREAVGLWKDWVHRLTTDMPGNRVVFSCRSLDYSQPLSTPSLRVPQVRIEPLSNGRIREFIKVYSPLHWRQMWSQLDGSPQLDALRSPYFLKLLTEQVEATGDMPEGRAALFTGFVRQTLRREVEQENPLFSPNDLLTSRDVRRVAHWRWNSPHELPDRGLLLPKLASLAYAMQNSCTDGETSQVRLRFDEALSLLDNARGRDILLAGVALSVVDEDPGSDEIMFVHQLLQEYFAGRELARSFDPKLVRSAWRARRIRPSAEAVIAALEPSEALPRLPRTAWEESALFAATMADDPVAFVRGIVGRNLVLAARCAAQAEVKPSLTDEIINELRLRLARRLEDTEADVRHRVDCGDALCELGDPRFERLVGPDGEYLMPPLLPIPAGSYPIGDDEPIVWSWSGASGTATSHMPRHDVTIKGVQIGRFPVTNAEWDRFMQCGGYDDERWWVTESDRAWRAGTMPDEGAKANNRMWRRRFLDDPALFDKMVEEDRFADGDAAERWRRWLQLDDRSFEAALDGQWQAKRETEPRFWRDTRFNRETLPVVGIGWYEARAYCAWLSAQTGLTVRLPTEVELEAATRGVEARRFAHGFDVDPMAANTFETHVRATSPVGAFPRGRTPEGVDDLSGNVCEWTSSLYGAGGVHTTDPDFAYPYDPTDGREDPNAPPTVRRVLRGGVWNNLQSNASAASRNYDPPGNRLSHYGMRVVVD